MERRLGGFPCRAHLGSRGVLLHRDHAPINEITLETQDRGERVGV